MVETPKLVLEALESELTVDHVIVPGDQHPDPDIAERCELDKVRLFGLEPDAFTKLSDARTPQPALAVVETPSLEVDDRFTSDGMYLVLVDVADPGNVGTLIRTAEATGCAGVIVTSQTADVLSPKTVRASAGSMLRVPLGEVEFDELPATLERLGVRTLATAMDGAAYSALDVDPAHGLAIILGSEAHGLDPAIAAAADDIVSIPMHGKVESLNVATTGAVLAFHHASIRGVPAV